jgi:hypothetical protein
MQVTPRCGMQATHNKTLVPLILDHPHILFHINGIQTEGQQYTTSNVTQEEMLLRQIKKDF